MGLLDRFVNDALSDLNELARLIEALFDSADPPEDLGAAGGQIIEEVSPIDEFAGIIVDTLEESVVAPLQEEGELTPENIETIQDDAEGNAAQLGAAAIGLTILIENSNLDFLESHGPVIAEFLAGSEVLSAVGREAAARVEEGVDPALTQKVNREHRSKQIDFQDFAEANLRAKAVSGEIPTLSGGVPEGLRDLLPEEDLDFFSEPDTYGIRPEQTELLSLISLESREPEEIIEEPIQYGIPVPKSVIRQQAILSGMPADSREIYESIADALPQSENLIQEYIRLTEVTFELRQKVRDGALTPEQARATIQPELDDLIQNALPEERLDEIDRTAEETAEQAGDELQRNFALLAGLPDDPPTQAEIGSLYRRGIISGSEFVQLTDQFGGPIEFVGEFLQEEAIRQGAEDIAEQHILGRLSTQEARSRLRLIGFDSGEAGRILGGTDPDDIIQERLEGQGGQEGLSPSLVPNIGDVRTQQLAIVGIQSVSDLATADIETVTAATGLTDTQAANAIESAQFIVQAGAGA